MVVFIINFSINLLSSVIHVIRLFLKKKFAVFCLQISFALPYLVNSENYPKGKYNQLFLNIREKELGERDTVLITDEMCNRLACYHFNCGSIM